ncbi:hypothetical protein V6N12_076501 [Hibiscus sabdariffa]|uniref:Uncharacterized protein n=1 Tax=Hibiscus sabdariffa TaxID=183260 RepID=A0ABR2D9Z4_9ROSI
MILPVRVEEIGFSDRFTAPSARGPKQSKEKEEPGLDSQSFASSESSKEPWLGKQQCNVVLEDEAVNAIWEDGTMREGDEPKVPNEDDDIINWVVRVNEKSNIAKSPIVNSETEDPSNFSKGRGYVPKRALKDVSDMGLSSAVGVLVQNGMREKNPHG